MSCTTCLEFEADPASPATCPDCGTPQFPVTTPDTRAPTGRPAPNLPPTLGRYRLSTELGRGGSGIVVRAHDMELDREVALKVLPPDPLLRGARTLRFEREGRALAGFQHPRVVTVHDVGEEGDFLFMAMDLMERTLAEHLPERGSQPGPEQVRRALHWMLQACEGLAALHGGGLVHRDVKPSNLLLGPDGEVRVADLGIALLPGESTLTLTGHGVGTIAYSAPEQLEGERATIASDVYGLGATLHALLTGRPPALRGDVSVDGLPREVRRVLRRALATDPNLRYPSAETLAADLLRILRGRSAWRARAMVAGGLLLLGVGGAAISWLTADGPTPAAIVSQMGRNQFEEEIPALSLRARGYRWDDLLAGGLADMEQDLEIEGVIHQVRLVPRAGRSWLELHGPQGLLAKQELPSAGAPNERWRLHASPVDVDGDGFDDTVLKSTSQLLMIKWEVQALDRPELGWRRRITARFDQGSPALVDYDGDGKLEVLIGDAPMRYGTNELAEPTLHALDFDTGKTKQRWRLPTTEFVKSTPQVCRTPDGRVERVYVDTESLTGVGGGTLFGLEPDGRLSEIDVPEEGAGRFTWPRFVDADGDGSSDLVFSRLTGSLTCVPAAAPSRPHWTWRVNDTNRVALVLSQQDDDPLPEACHAFDFGFQCLNVEPDAPSRLEWAAGIHPEVEFFNAGVEVPDLNGDGLLEIAVSSADGIHVFSRAAPGGSFAVLSLSDVEIPTGFVARPVVLPGDAGRPVRVIGVTPEASIACWRLSADEVQLEWVWTTPPTMPQRVTATPQAVRWSAQDGRERLGVLVLAGLLHLLELDESGLPRPVWSTWSPVFSAPHSGDGTPIVHRDQDGLWVVFTRAPGEVCKVPLRPSDGTVQPMELAWQVR